MSNFQVPGKAVPVRMSRSQSGPVQSNDTTNASRSSSRLSSTGARKTLPQIPDCPAVPTLPASDKPNFAFGDTNFQPFFIEYALRAEYNMLLREKVPGVYVVPSAKSAFVWNGVMFIRQGIYQDAIFRFTINIPQNFPDCDCPSVIFSPSVFHPIIDPETGSLDVVRAFHKWRRSVHHLSHILMYARRIFFKIETNEPVNKTAAELYENQPDAFKQKVVECIENHKATLYNDPDPSDANSIRFSEWDEAVHGPTRQRMLSSPPNMKQ